ncbi:SPBc2 prophage-derived aminoglycoside N(3')-acetyltransferase-like protein YokD [Streptomyces sp. MA5143a]|nr:SPBc2 prophage-derived aminoglycoside N(3')-acetyltransferase-like protein YokD [Streptomyces sp. MA5143a]
MADATGPQNLLHKLRNTLAEVGVRPGSTLMVHSSLGGTGLGATAVRDVLLRAVGPDGTLVVPAFTPENSDTSREYRRMVEGMTEQERAEFRAGVLPFEQGATPCPTMGALAECVRSTPGALRSAHPQTSFAGLGPRAAELLTGHDPHCHLGEGSPMARLYEADARILLLRVGFEVCSAFHLAEYRMTPPPSRRTYRCVVEEKGNWIEYEDLDLYDGDFGEIGARVPRDLYEEGEWAGSRVVHIGVRDAVDAASRIMSGYRR